MRNIFREIFNLDVVDSKSGSQHQSAVVGLGWTSNGERHCKVDSNESVSVWVENAGTVARFLLPVFAFLFCDATGKSQSVKSVTMDGNRYMRERPLGELVASLKSSFTGIEIVYLQKEGRLPVKISRSQGAGRAAFPGGTIEIRNQISSQFVSALLMIAPLAEHPVELRLMDFEELEGVEGKRVVSQPYIDMTIGIMKEFGIAVTECGRGVYRVPNGELLTS